MGRYSAAWENPHYIGDECPGRKARVPTTSATNYYLGFDLGVARSINAVAVIAHNGYSVGASQVRLKVGSADAGLAFDINVHVITAAAACEPSYLGTFNAVSKRYWELEFVSVDAGYELELGAVILGTSYTFDEVPSSPLASPDYSQSKVVSGLLEVPARIQRGDPYDGRVILWSLASATLADDFVDIATALEGAGHPIPYADHNATAITTSTGVDTYPCGLYRITSFKTAQLADASRHTIKLALQEVA
jgi:hypothetical protein